MLKKEPTRSVESHRVRLGAALSVTGMLLMSDTAQRGVRQLAHLSNAKTHTPEKDAGSLEACASRCRVASVNAADLVP